MSTIDRLAHETEAEERGEKLEKTFDRFNVNISISNHWILADKIIYEAKLKKNTTLAQVFAHASDVKFRLKLPLLQVVPHKFAVYIITSDQEIVYPHLPKVLSSSSYLKSGKRQALPYVMGYTPMGELIMADLAQFPHLLMGGSTNSGKTVGLRSLITSIAYIKSPAQVNFILIDVGATDLMVFDGIPHLSCPVVRNQHAACNTLAALQSEMERRIKLEYAEPNKFKLLPRLVLVIDEFTALFTGLNSKDVSKSTANAISSLLQRGRHAKIHLVLAAQNPVFRNMKVDLGNITARIAFRCAKKNFSETILGEGGAEYLSRQGAMLLRSPQHDNLQQIQGVYITPEELRQSVQQIKATPHHLSMNKFNLDIPNTLSTATIGNLVSPSPHAPITRGLSDDKMMFAMVVRHVLTKTQVSTNSIMKDFGFGWNRADRYMKQLEEWGIVSEVIGKQARRVLPIGIEDLPAELIAFMGACGISENSLCDAFAEMS